MLGEASPNNLKTQCSVSFETDAYFVLQVPKLDSDYDDFGGSSSATMITSSVSATITADG